MRRLLAFSCALLLAGIFCLSQQEHVSAFWQSRDSNYNVSVASGGTNPIGTPVVIWQDTTGNTSTSGNSAFPTTADCPIGSLVVLALDAAGGGSVGTGPVADTRGNAYSKGAAINTGGDDIETWYSSNITNDLTLGSEFVATTVGAAQWKAPWALCIANANSGLDAAQTLNVSSATTISIPTGTLAQAFEIVISNINNSGSITGWTESASFTTGLSPATQAQGWYYGYYKTPSTSSVTWNPSWSPSQTTLNGVVVSFKH